MRPFRPLSLQTRLWWFACVLSATPLHADRAPPTVSQVESVNGKYVFRVVPNWGKVPPQPGTCQGELYLCVDGDLKLQWKRPLINNIAPTRAFVANSGKYVVTICELVNETNLEVPVVIYDRQGFLVNVWGRLEQLDPSLMGFISNKKGTDWLEESLFLFGSDDGSFIIRTGVGQLFVFDTERGALIDERWKENRRLFPDDMKYYDQLHADAKGLVLREAIRLKNSDASTGRKLGETILSQYTDAESVAILRQITQPSENKSNEPGRQTKNR